MTDATLLNPSGWPPEILPFLSRAFTCEYATQTRAGQPLTVPITPHLGVDGSTVDVATGLAYPLKAERARNDNKVCLLFSYPTGTGLEDAPTVLIYGEATVRDANLQANTDRYVALSMQKFDVAGSSLSRFVHRRGGWYYSRIWVHVTPLKILRWPGGDLDLEPLVWTAPDGTHAPPSDPKPKGKSPGKIFAEPEDWRPGARHSVEKMGAPVVTVLDADGYPVPMRMKAVETTDEGFRITPPAHLPTPIEGRVCVTFHSHPKVFTSQENIAFVGEATPTGGALDVRVTRQIGSFSLGRSAGQAMKSFFTHGRAIKKRLKGEAARRGQKVPKVNLP